MTDKKKRARKKKPRWPDRKLLEESTDVMWRFQKMCEYQLDVGHWATMDFPTKHHINKILSLQYLETEVVEQVYGPVLSKRALELVPVCKKYLDFIKVQSYEMDPGEARNKGKK